MASNRELHSPLGASSCHRWLNCPGSVARSAGIVEAPSIHAATGTLVHSLCESAINYPRGELFPAIGSVHEVDGYEITVTSEMLDNATAYADIVRSRMKNRRTELLVEFPIELDWLHPGMFGRLDAMLRPLDKFDTLDVFDYKNGSTRVDATGNEQMMYYALAGVGPVNRNLSIGATMTIVQPNCFGKPLEDKWETPIEDLISWGYDVLLPGVKATEEPDAPLRAGDWCHWCPCRSNCPALAAYFEKQAGEALDMVAVGGTPAELTVEKLSRYVATFTSPEFFDWVKSLAGYELELAQRGVKLPGRKLIQTFSKGNRMWVDEAKTVEQFRNVLNDELFEMKVKSPARMEAALKAAGFSKSEAADMVFPLVMQKVNEGFAVVDENDERPEYAPEMEAKNWFENKEN